MSPAAAFLNPQNMHKIGLKDTIYRANKKNKKKIKKVVDNREMI